MELKIIYGVIAIVSLILIIGYLTLIRKRDKWFLLLFVSVFVVNTGYFALSVSGSLEEALMANRISYFGSVFLPLSMLIIIIEACQCKRHKWAVIVATCISIVVFLIAASQGYCDLYYEDVTITFVDGAAKLVKDYGPLHNVYYIYLLTYIIAMIGVIVFAYIKKKAMEYKHAIFLTCIALGNIFVWFIEQMVEIDFEFLSISYIITELFLLSMYMMLQEIEKVKKENVVVGTPNGANISMDEIIEAHPEFEVLTAREKDVLKLILKDVKRSDIAAELNVSENTIKKHTANIFSKLGVSSRKELYVKVNQRK